MVRFGASRDSTWVGGGSGGAVDNTVDFQPACRGLESAAALLRYVPPGGP